jgi:hypothetical protein
VLTKTRKHVILIQDGEPYHTSAATHAFFAKNSELLTVFNLPSYSPDFNPIEKLWKKIKKEGIHLHYFPTFQDLEVLSLFGMNQNTKQAAWNSAKIFFLKAIDGRFPMFITSTTIATMLAKTETESCLG